MIRTRIRHLLSLLGSPAPSPASATPSPSPEPAAPSPVPDERYDGARFDPRLAQPSRFRRVADRVVRRVDSVSNTLTGIGTVNDKGAAGRPDVQQSELTFDELTALWRFNGYAKKIVSQVPNDATRKGWNVTCEGLDPEEIEKETKRLSVVGRVAQWMTWAHLYGGSVMLIVTEEDEPPVTGRARHSLLAEPLDLSRVKRIKNLIILDKREATPLTYDGQIESDTFRQPLTWWISPASPGGIDGFGGGREVHSSRLIYMYGSRLSPTQRLRTLDGMDDSILQGVWDQVRNRTGVDQALAILAGEIRVNVLKMRGLADLSASDQAEVAEERFRLIARGTSMLNLILLSDDETYEQKSGSVAGVGDLVAPANQSLCAVSGMPASLLFGDAPSGLNTDGASAEKTWSKVIAAVQRMKINDPLEKLYRVICSQSEVFTGGVVGEGELMITYRPLDEPTEAETAATRKTYSEIDESYIDSGVYTAADVAESRFGESGWSPEIAPVTVPDIEAVDPESLAAAEVEIARLKAAEEGAAPAGEEAPRADAHDAHDALWLMIPAPESAGFDEALSAASAILPDIQAVSSPHMTILYLGDVDDSRVEEVAQLVTAEVEKMTIRGVEFNSRGLGYFAPAGESTPIVMGLYSYQAERLNENLTRALAHLIEAPQRPDYRCHMTIGFLPRDLLGDEAEHLSGVSRPDNLTDEGGAVGRHSFEGSELLLMRGGNPIRRLLLGVARMDSGRHASE